MTIISSSDLDAQMGRQIDPNSVPTHDGTGAGHMQGVINRGSDTQIVEQGAGKFGTAVHSGQEVGGDRFYGSSTVISIKDLAPLPDKSDPDVVVVPAPIKPPTALRLPPFTFPKMPAKAPAPVQAAPPGAPMPVAALLAQMGLKKKP